MKPELISFKLCPFVQRSLITVRHKGVDVALRYIDLANKDQHQYPDHEKGRYKIQPNPD